MRKRPGSNQKEETKGNAKNEEANPGQVGKLEGTQQTNGEFMILSGISCEDMAAFNYMSDVNLDEYEDMVLQFEELLTEIDSGKPMKN